MVSIYLEYCIRQPLRSFSPNCYQAAVEWVFKPYMATIWWLNLFEEAVLRETETSCLGEKLLAYHKRKVMLFQICNLSSWLLEIAYATKGIPLKRQIPLLSCLQGQRYTCSQQQPFIEHHLWMLDMWWLAMDGCCGFFTSVFDNHKDGLVWEECGQVFVVPKMQGCNWA